jgi:hypothetical protein
MKVRVLQNFYDVTVGGMLRGKGGTYDEPDKKRVKMLAAKGIVVPLDPFIETSSPPQTETKKRKPRKSPRKPRRKPTKK